MIRASDTDFVFHLAARASSGFDTAKPGETYVHERARTVQLLDALRLAARPWT